MPYGSVQDVKTHLGIVGSTYDSFIAAQITYTSQLADVWTGRNFADVTLGSAFKSTHSVSEVFFLHDGDTNLVLREWPLVSITSVTDDGVTVDADRYETEDTYGELRFIDDQNLEDLRFGRVEVNYVAGFTSTPAPVLAFVRRATSYILNRRLREGVGASLLADSQETYRSPERELKNIFHETAGGFVLDHTT